MIGIESIKNIGIKNNNNNKKPEIQDYIVIGDYVDLYSFNDKKWRLSLIVGIKKDELELAFDGGIKK